MRFSPFLPFLFSSMIFVRSRAMLKMTMSSTMMIPPSEQPIAVDAERRNSTTPCTNVKYPSIPFGQKSAWRRRGGEEVEEVRWRR